MVKILIWRDVTLGPWIVVATGYKELFVCILKDRVVHKSPFTIYPYTQAKEMITFFETLGTTYPVT
jgi:hypothetical protein